MEKESTFLTYVRHTFKRWSGFQEAINNGMGGPYAKEKETWIGTEVENYFKQYSGVVPDEMEDYLGSMIENEFDTYFEDGSLQEVSKNFCTAYRLSLTDPQHAIFQEMQQKASSIQNPTVPTSTFTSQARPEEVACEEMETSSFEEVAVEADGWTTVTKKNKKTR